MAFHVPDQFCAGRARRQMVFADYSRPSDSRASHLLGISRISKHIATNILASRMNLLTCLKLIERTNPEATARNNAYQLTEKGAALRPVLEGLARWAQTHLKAQHHSMASIS